MTYSSDAKKNKQLLMLLKKKKKEAKKDTYSITPAQKRMFLLSKGKNGHSYNISFSLTINGPLNIELFTNAIHHITERHDNLKSTFTLSKSKIEKNVIHDYLPTIKLTDFSNKKKVTTSIKKREIKLANTRFSITETPPFKIEILKLSSRKHIVLFCFHHILFDGWSATIFFKELENFYKNKPYLEAIQVSDNSLKTSKAAVNYWEKVDINTSQFGKFTKSSKRTKQNNSLRICETSFSKEETLKIISFCQQKKTTPSILFLSSYLILLRIITNTSNICTGIPVANRNNKHSEKEIGLFVNTLPLTLNINLNQSFEHILESTQKHFFKMLQNQLDLDEIIRIKNPERVTENTSLFNTLYVFQNQNILPPKLPECSTSIRLITPLSPAFKLVLESWESESKFTSSLKYDSSHFSKEAITYYLETFKKILFLTIETSRESISSILPKEKTLSKSLVNLSLIKEIYEKHQDNTDVALISNEISISYRELLITANKIKNYLCKNKYSRVAIHLNKSPDYIATILGCILAKAAYVPLDLTFPAEHIENIISDSKCDIIVSNTQEFSAPTFKSKDILESLEYPSKNIENPEIYIIYTSGSTGKPKGVIVKEQALLNYLDWCRKKYLDLDKNNTALLTPLSFDLTITTIFPSLMSGSTIFIYDDKNQIQNLLSAVKNQNIHYLKLTPSHLRIINEFNLTNDNIKLFIIGGETLRNRDLKVNNKLFKNARHINEYGPTETVVGCMNYTYNPFIDKNRENTPIGNEIQNFNIEVITPEGLPCLPYTEGEIKITSTFISSGYTQKELNTTFSFQTDTPYYKSGDFAFKDIHNCLYFLGRKDSERKVFGNRINLEYIEKIIAIKLHASQVKTIVTPESTIVAFHNSKSVSNEKEALDSLKKILPAYMLPKQIIKINTFPINTNGKIDISKLKNNLSVVKGTSQNKKETNTVIENIWKEVLNRQTIEKDLSFFEQGGTSIDALKLIENINTHFHTDSLNLHDLFTHQTLNEFINAFNTKSHSSQIRPLHYESQNEPNIIYLSNMINEFQEAEVLFKGTSSKFNLYTYKSPATESIQKAAIQLNNELKSFKNTTSFIIGWSFNGLLAYETSLLNNTFNFLSIDSHLYHKNIITPDVLKNITGMGIQNKSSNNILELLNTTDIPKTKKETLINNLNLWQTYTPSLGSSNCKFISALDQSLFQNATLLADFLNAPHTKLDGHHFNIIESIEIINLLVNNIKSINNQV